MKKMFLAVAAIGITTAAFSQVRFGIQAIGNAGTASIKSDDMKNASTDFKIGAGAGLVADYSLSEKFGVRGSLNFLQKKSEVTYQTAEFEDKPFTISSTLNYLELPIQAIYKIPLNNMKIIVGAGPSFGYGIGGKLKAKGWMEGDVKATRSTSYPYQQRSSHSKKKRMMEPASNALTSVPMPLRELNLKMACMPMQAIHTASPTLAKVLTIRIAASS
jgi:hypothetical protein